MSLYPPSLFANTPFNHEFNLWRVTHSLNGLFSHWKVKKGTTNKGAVVNDRLQSFIIVKSANKSYKTTIYFLFKKTTLFKRIRFVFQKSEKLKEFATNPDKKNKLSVNCKPDGLLLEY